MVAGISKTYPQLSLRVLDIVRRVGGWKRLATMDEQNRPFIKKEWIEEYTHWHEVAAVPVERMLSARRVKAGKTKAVDVNPSLSAGNSLFALS